MRIVILGLCAPLWSCKTPATHTGTAPASTSARLAPATAPSSTGANASPFAGRSLRNAPAEIEAFNAWAERAGLRENLAALVALGLPVSSEVRKISIEVEYAAGESPMAATVTAVQDGFLDDSVRGERSIWRFERKACTACASGKSPWTLRAVEDARRCWPGRGHLEFSREPCE
jgi:hypothetical protein